MRFDVLELVPAVEDGVIVVRLLKPGLITAI